MKTVRDLDRTSAAFEAMNHGEVVALSNCGYTQTDGRDVAVTALHDRGLDPARCSIVFWHRQSHEGAFDDDGNLVGGLTLHWNGEREKVARLLVAAHAA